MSLEAMTKGVYLKQSEWRFLEGLAVRIARETNKRPTITLAIRRLIEKEHEEHIK